MRENDLLSPGKVTDISSFKMQGDLKLFVILTSKSYIFTLFNSFLLININAKIAICTNCLFILSFSPGAIVPMTTEGNIVVDGVLASCYGSYDHDLAHLLMTPFGYFPFAMTSIFGGDNESPVYVNMAGYLGEWLLPYQSVY